METFWYRLTKVHLEKWLLKRRAVESDAQCMTPWVARTVTLLSVKIFGVIAHREHKSCNQDIYAQN